jgi:cytoskeletal protein RodZ
VSEVSRQTRIRESIIRDIEHDDYASCGGDFYVRGNIRAIGRAVGADPGPLVQRCDAAHPADHVVKAGAPLPMTGSRLGGGHRPLNWTAILTVALVVALGFAVYLVVASGHGPG